MNSRFGKVLLVGGTGMLANTARHLAEGADSMVLGARRPEPLAVELGAIPWAFDWTDQCSALNTLVPMPAFDLVVSWLHLDGLWLAEHLESKLKTGGHSVRIHSNAATQPETLARRNPRLRAGLTRQNIILGRMVEPEYRRWLTPDEINRGVIKALSAPETALVNIGDAPLPSAPADQ